MHLKILEVEWSTDVNSLTIYSYNEKADIEGFIVLNNTSIFDVPFYIHFNNLVFKIFPTEGTIMAKEAVKIFVTAFMPFAKDQITIESSDINFSKCFLPLSVSIIEHQFHA